MSVHSHFTDNNITVVVVFLSLTISCFLLSRTLHVHDCLRVNSPLCISVLVNVLLFIFIIETMSIINASLHMKTDVKLARP